MFIAVSRYSGVDPAIRSLRSAAAPPPRQIAAWIVERQRARSAHHVAPIVDGEGGAVRMARDGSSARIFVARVQMKVRLVWLQRRYNTRLHAFLTAQPGEAGALAAK